MIKTGTVKRLPVVAIERFTARDDQGTPHEVTRWSRPFRVLELSGWSAIQHTDKWMTAGDIEVTIQPDGSLWMQSDPPTRLQR